jgi:hypothetical protein
MHNNRKLFIFGYWYSSNLGDFLAPWLIWKCIALNKSECKHLFLVNLIEPSVDDSISKEFLSTNGEMLIIKKPSEIINLIESDDIIILTVGSITAEQSALATIALIRALSINIKIIVWGGLQDYSKMLTDSQSFVGEINFWREFIKDPNVEFWARSKPELNAIFKITQFESSSVKVAGDPIALFSIVFKDFITKCKSEILVKNDTLLITSSHIFDRDIPFAREFHDFLAIKPQCRIIGIDSSTDVLLEKSYGVDTINDVYALIKLILSYRYIISGRLHGALIAACLGVDVIYIALNEKFENISYFSEGEKLFEVDKDFLNCFDLNNRYFVNNNSTEKFISQAYSSIGEINC